MLTQPGRWLVPADPVGAAWGTDRGWRCTQEWGGLVSGAAWGGLISVGVCVGGSPACVCGRGAGSQTVRQVPCLKHGGPDAYFWGVPSVWGG